MKGMSFSRARNDLDAAEDDYRNQSGHRHADDHLEPRGVKQPEHRKGLSCDRRISRHRSDRARKGIRLNRGADAERGDGGEQGERDAENLAERLVLEAALQGVHGASEHVAVVVFDAVLQGDRRFGILRGDTEDAGKPHPEQGAWSAGDQRRADADDVAGADGCGEGCGEGLEGADVAVALVFSDGKLNAGEELSLDDSCPERHEDVFSQKEKDHDGSPYEPVDRRDDIFDSGGRSGSRRRKAFPRAYERLDEELVQEVFHRVPNVRGRRPRAFLSDTVRSDGPEPFSATAY